MGPVTGEKIQGIETSGRQPVRQAEFSGWYDPSISSIGKF
jgi:hypothetical protein